MTNGGNSLPRVFDGALCLLVVSQAGVPLAVREQVGTIVARVELEAA